MNIILHVKEQRGVAAHCMSCFLHVAAFFIFSDMTLKEVSPNNQQDYPSDRLFRVNHHATAKYHDINFNIDTVPLSTLTKLVFDN